MGSGIVHVSGLRGSIAQHLGYFRSLSLVPDICPIAKVPPISKISPLQIASNNDHQGMLWLLMDHLPNVPNLRA